MHRSTSLSRARSPYRPYLVTVVVAALFYFVPLGVMAACIGLGWHA